MNDFCINSVQFISNRYIIGADEGTRTPTPLALVPKTSASTSSATSAYQIYLTIIIIAYLYFNCQAILLIFYTLKYKIKPPIIAKIKPNIFRPLDASF